jgi:crotonobetainyl-CoA:carnitine CoA-transferase CaiB-like acyl-CoA transferase
MDLTGPRGGAPHKVGTSIADLVSGLTAAQGILAALYAAKIDGRGQRVNVSMYEAVAALLTFNASIYFATGNSPRRRGNEHATIVPYETFEASDGWINLAFLTMKIVQILGKLAEDLARTCEKSRAPDQPRLQSTQLACPQPR